jgi:hypothetical protein
VDVAKLVELSVTLGPGAGFGFSLGLLLFIGGLLSKKWLMWGRFDDVQKLYEEAKRDKASAEKDRDVIRVERDELRIMMAGALAVTRKNAYLASSVMIRRVQEQEGTDDGPEPASLTSGRG